MEVLETFNDLRDVIGSASDHISDLDAKLSAFFVEKNTARIIDYDRDSGQDVYKVRLIAQIPGKTRTLTKNALEDLRSALDHAVYASAITLRPGTQPSRTAFPFAHDAAGVHERLNRDLVDIPPEIRTLVEEFRPHQNGNALLWALNNTRNTQTHRLLVPLGTVALGTVLGIGYAELQPPSQIGYSKWDPAKNEVEYMRLGSGSTFEHTVDVTFQAVFGDAASTVLGQPVIPMLNAFRCEVESVVRAIEAETEKLLRILP
ncbi:MAG: hypothetical protein K0U74_04365 [Alphaproteobacteria bacterium]|nr:hypothetical protein [Alphaproteobacteria bacterium]